MILFIRKWLQRENILLKITRSKYYTHLVYASYRINSPFSRQRSVKKKMKNKRISWKIINLLMQRLIFDCFFFTYHRGKLIVSQLRRGHWIAVVLLNHLISLGKDGSMLNFLFRWIQCGVIFGLDYTVIN